MKNGGVRVLIFFLHLQKLFVVYKRVYPAQKFQILLAFSHFPFAPTEPHFFGWQKLLHSLICFIFGLISVVCKDATV